MMRTSVLRAPRLASVSTLTFRAAAVLSQSRSSASHAVSNVTLADIEKRWEVMLPSEQADLWMSLRDRMKGSWGDLTVQEKKASYWIAFGPHGPRAVPPEGEGRKVILYTLVGLGASFILFYSTRLFARPPPRTLTKEWEEASNEYMKENKIEPITGVSSEGYKGSGMVQSK